MIIRILRIEFTILYKTPLAAVFVSDQRARLVRIAIVREHAHETSALVADQNYCSGGRLSGAINLALKIRHLLQAMHSHRWNYFHAFSLEVRDYKYSLKRSQNVFFKKHHAYQTATGLSITN